jgi:hypothetical protein
MRDPNPYNYNLPVEPDMFFGRAADVASLAQRLTAPQGDSFALIGGRRMGKTSLLEALLRALDGMAIYSPGSVLPIPVFIDLSGEGLVSTTACFRSIIAAVETAFVERLPALPGAMQIPDQVPPVPAFRTVLDTWNRAAMARYGRQIRLILLLDECEEIVDQPWATEMHAALRALLVGQATRGRLRVVMAGSHRFLSQVHQRGSPLWNVLIYHRLWVLDEPTTRDLIVQPTGGVLPEPVIEAVIAQSGGHPRLTQYLMYHLCAQGLTLATPEIVAQIAAAFPGESQDFQDWMRGLSVGGVAVYNALTCLDTPVAEDDLRLVLPLPPTEVSQTLSALCYHGVVAQDADGRYRVAGQMFRTWFTTFNAVRPENAPVTSDERADQVAALRALLTVHHRRLYTLHEKQAYLGISADPAITMEIDDIQRTIADLEQQLTALDQ